MPRKKVSKPSGNSKKTTRRPRKGATASKPKPVAKKTVPVLFGNFGLGEQTAKIGCSILREKLNLDAADHLLCNSRCEVNLSLEDPNQDRIWDDGPPVVESVVDIKGFRVTSDKFGFGLTFSREEIEAGTLACFTRRTGILSIKWIGEPVPAKRGRPSADDQMELGD